jgi:hypothetical protein
MADMQTHAALARWAARNFDHNLGFLPEERLEWKPEPTCKSAAEVTGEVAGVIRMALKLLSEGRWGQPEFPRPATLAEAREMIRSEGERYAVALETAAPEALSRAVDSPFGRMRVERAILFPLIDMIHHHGQICYLQSLLGDAEGHGDMEAMRECFGADGPADAGGQ